MHRHIIASLLLFSPFLYCDESTSDVEARIKRLEEWKAQADKPEQNEPLTPPPQQQPQTQPPPQPIRKMEPSEMYNQPSRPVVHENPDVFVLGELLFLTPIQGGMEFAFLSDGGPGTYVGFPAAGTEEIPGGVFGHPVHGKVRSALGKWDWGFRVGVGYNLIRDGWDVNADWMRFHTLHDKSNRPNKHGAPIVPLIAPPWSGTNSTPPNQPGAFGGRLFLVTNTRARWKLNVDLIDLEMGKEFNISHWMSVRPYMGPRTAFIPQSLRTTFYGGTFVANFVSDLSFADNLNQEPASVMQVHLRNNFWGIGPRAGCGTSWKLGAGFSLYGNADFSLLWGSFHTKTRFDITPGAPSTRAGIQTTIANIRNNHPTMRPNADLSFGVRYDYNFDDAYALGALFGYENMYFWNQNEYMKFGDSVTPLLNIASDNLGLAGFHLGVIFDF